MHLVFLIKVFVRLPAYSTVQAGVRGAVVSVGLTEPALPARGAGAGHLQEGGLEEDQAALGTTRKRMQ